MSAELYPSLSSFETGRINVGDGNLVYWETCGNPKGKPAVVLHGGPGSGCNTWHRRLFNPSRYKIVLFDQRNCGRSTPHASGSTCALEHNTIRHLLDDIERLRNHLGIQSWMVLGGSWGSVLGLAYAEAHPDRVTELVLFGAATGQWHELDWLFRGGLSRFFPVEWDSLRRELGCDGSDAQVVPRCHELLYHDDESARARAAEAWCLWESATPNWPPTVGLAPRFKDPHYALAFARIVTHYVLNNLFLEDGALIRNSDALSGIPGSIIQGRFDFQAPLASAYELARAWPPAELVVVNDARHSAASDGISRNIVLSTNRFASS